MTGHEKVQDLVSWESVNGFDTTELAREYFNCGVSILNVESGDIWIASPQTGHHVTDDDLSAFVDWVNRANRNRVF